MLEKVNFSIKDKELIDLSVTLRKGIKSCSKNLLKHADFAFIL